MKIEVSNGEVVDRWTILTLKMVRIVDEAARANIHREMTMLSEHVHELGVSEEQLSELWTVNAALWDVEDKLRLLESEQSFGEEFIEAARSVYLLNDDRARLKKEINEQTGSLLVEEKSYTTYEVPADD